MEAAITKCYQHHQTISFKGETTMFDTLSDQIRADEKANVTSRERVMRWSMVLLVTVLLFLGFYLLPQLG
jgi:hypothetical protein